MSQDVSDSILGISEHANKHLIVTTDFDIDMKKCFPVCIDDEWPEHESSVIESLPFLN